MDYGSSSRRPRTPQETLQGFTSRSRRTSGSSEFSDDGKTQSDNSKPSQPVDLIISNLDASISIKELRKLLTVMIKEYAMILGLNVTMQADGTPIANIKVNNQQAAQFIISQLHRQKLGHKRIIISYAQNNSPDPEQLKAMVISILQTRVVTVTGAKNAKLICIRDDNSDVETDEEGKKDKEVMTDVKVRMATSETQTDLLVEQNRARNSRSSIKISQLPKTNKKLLQLLPKEYAINIIQYKLRYAHFHKQNRIYRKSANVQPWILMGRISDDILDYVLRSVTAELEVNEILEDLYNAEFQY